MFKITFFNGRVRAHVVSDVNLGELPAVISRVIEFLNSVKTPCTQIVLKSQSVVGVLRQFAKEEMKK